MKYKIWKKFDDTSENHHLSQKNKYIRHPPLKSFLQPFVFPASCFPQSTIPSNIRQILIWFLSLEMSVHFPGFYIIKFIQYVFIFLTSFRDLKTWDLRTVLQVSTVHFFSLLSSTALYEYIINYFLFTGWWKFVLFGFPSSFVFYIMRGNQAEK